MSTLSNSVIARLKASLSSTSSIVTPDSDNYAASLARWSDAAEKPARIIVFPATADDVATALLFGAAQSLYIAVRGGGHSTSSSSSTDGGLCIDLSNMRKVSVDIVAKTITAQGGALWSDVDSAGAEHNLVTPGGTVNHTGIGGLTLGGGYGWLTGQYGLVIDNLLACEVVLADGSIVTASDKENQDLFWALRGAGACFGIVTSFMYRAYDQKGLVWAGALVFPATNLGAVVEATNSLAAVENAKAGLFVNFTNMPGLPPVVLTILFYDGSEDEANAFYKPLLDLKPLVNQTGAMPYPVVNSILNPNAPHGGRKSMKGTAVKLPLSVEFAESIFQDLTTFVQKVPDALRTVILFEYIPNQKVLEVSSTATAYANRGDYYNVLICPAWTDVKNDDVCRAFARDTNTKIKNEFLRTKNSVDGVAGGVGTYGNYDSKSLLENL